MQPNLDISTDNRKKSAHILNLLLADEFVLYTKTLNYHWNIESLHFHDLHKFLEAQYEEILEIVDSVAERIRAIGHHSFGTMQEYMKNTRLKEFPGKVPSDKEMLKKLLEDHEAIIRTLRVDQEVTLTKLKDAGTSNFLLNLLEQHEKMAWMLRACL
ncbi:MAG: DNA starvation/stationary phase protection protein [Candidatus Babeliales bacterium]|nr:DNA starvation/stationary phase protection protein [Candidatus Babeliales bacterium]